MRVFRVLGLVALCACSNDVFTAQDGGDDGSPATDSSPSADADGPDAAPTEAGVADAIAPDVVASSTQVTCAAGTCIGAQACCQGLNWPGASCKPSSVEGQSGCNHYLACDDSSDCPGQVCCASETNDLGTWVISVAQCSSSCGQTNTVQLCKDSSECGGKSCQDFAGNPSWLKSCQ